MGLTQSSVLDVPGVGVDKRDPPKINCHRYGCIPKDRLHVFWNVIWLGVSGVWGCMVVLFNAVVVVVVVERKKINNSCPSQNGLVSVGSVALASNFL